MLKQLLLKQLFVTPHTRRRFTTIKLFSLSVLALFLLTACGGGGGSTPTPAPAPTPAPVLTPAPAPTPAPDVPDPAPDVPDPAPDVPTSAPDVPDNSGGVSAPVPKPFPRSAPTASINYASEKHRFETSKEYDVNWVLASDSKIGGTDRHLRRINAAAAYARGATGAGQTIAIVDAGIRDTHREFSGSGKVTKVTQSGYAPTDGDKYHGTIVAALAIGNRDGASGLNMHGVAFDARVHFTEIRLFGPEYLSFRPENHSNADDLRLAKQFNQYLTNARTAGAAIINASFGVNGAVSIYGRQEIRNSFTHTAIVLAQASTDNADKTIIVWAAGNDGREQYQNDDQVPFDSADTWSGLGAYFPELQSHVLAVVALDQDGSIASYSNRCGIAKDFCLAAPGSDVVSAGGSRDHSYRVLLSGTSYAAPLVSGSLALLRQYFRGQLGNTELVDRLLATANREGIYADSDTYGHGLVDLDAATAPVGAVMTGLPGDPDSRPFAASGIVLSGGAFGASLQEGGLADVEVAGFDSLGAPFFQSAVTWVREAQESGIDREAQKLSLLVSYQHIEQNNGLGLSWTIGGGAITDVRLSLAHGWWLSYGQHGGQSLGLYNRRPSLQGRFFQEPGGGADRIAAAHRFGDPLAFATPYLSLVRDGPGIGWSHAFSGTGVSKRLGFVLMHGAPEFNDHQNQSGKRGSGVLLNMSINPERLGGAGLSLQLGAVREADGFLGARPQGVFGKAHGATTFVGINAAWALGNNHWHLLASAYLGRTRPQIDKNGLLHDASPIVSSAFSIATARSSIWRQGDWFGLRLSQPLRAESGVARLRVATGRTKYGKVVYQNYTVSLVPTGRTIHTVAMYRIPIAGGALETRIGMARHPQHHSAHDIRPFMRLAFERRF